MEISRHQSAQALKRIGPPLSGAEELGDAVAMQAGNCGRLGDRHAPGRKEGNHAVELSGDAVHNVRKSTLLWANQAQSHNDGLAHSGVRCLDGRMPYDADNARKNIRAIMKREGLKPTPWAIESGLSKNALTNFLNGRTDSLTISTVTALAERAGLHPMELSGFGPPPEYSRLVRAVGEMVARLDPTNANDGTAFLLEQTRALLDPRRTPESPARQEPLRLPAPPPRRPTTRR